MHVKTRRRLRLAVLGEQAGVLQAREGAVRQAAGQRLHGGIVGRAAQHGQPRQQPAVARQQDLPPNLFKEQVFLELAVAGGEHGSDEFAPFGFRPGGIRGRRQRGAELLPLVLHQRGQLPHGERMAGKLRQQAGAGEAAQAVQAGEPVHHPLDGVGRHGGHGEAVSRREVVVGVAGGGEQQEAAGGLLRDLREAQPEPAAGVVAPRGEGVGVFILGLLLGRAGRLIQGFEIVEVEQEVARDGLGSKALPRRHQPGQELEQQLRWVAGVAVGFRYKLVPAGQLPGVHRLLKLAQQAADRLGIAFDFAAPEVDGGLAGGVQHLAGDLAENAFAQPAQAVHHEDALGRKVAFRIAPQLPPQPVQLAPSANEAVD